MQLGDMVVIRTDEATWPLTADKWILVKKIGNGRWKLERYDCTACRFFTTGGWIRRTADEVHLRVVGDKLKIVPPQGGSSTAPPPPPPPQMGRVRAS